jgi:hypothetical protein
MRPRSRTYELLVQLYPRGFREEFGSEMTLLFEEQLDDARREGRSTVAMLWVRTFADLVISVPGQHLRRARATAQPVVAQGASTDITISRPRRRWRFAVGLLPLLIWYLAGILAPGAVDPLFANPPAIAGLPAGVFVLAVVTVMTLAGAVVIATARSNTVVAAAVVLLTVPATVLLFLAPAVILLVQNLAT